MKYGNASIGDNTLLLLAVPVVGIAIYFLYRLNSVAKAGSELATTVLGGANSLANGIIETGKAIPEGIKSVSSSAAVTWDNWFSPAWSEPVPANQIPIAYRSLAEQDVFKQSVALNDLLGTPSLAKNPIDLTSPLTWMGIPQANRNEYLDNPLSFP